MSLTLYIMSQGFSHKSVSKGGYVFDLLLARVDFCCLLITFANSLDSDQARQNVRTDLNPCFLTPRWY